MPTHQKPHPIRPKPIRLASEGWPCVISSDAAAPLPVDLRASAPIARRALPASHQGKVEARKGASAYHGIVPQDRLRAQPCPRYPAHALLNTGGLGPPG